MDIDYFAITSLACFEQYFVLIQKNKNLETSVFWNAIDAT